MSTQTPRNAAGPDDTLIRPPAAADRAAPARPVRATAQAPVVLAVVGALLVLVVALYIVGYLMAGDKLPRTREISGVAVGGLDRAAGDREADAELGPGRPRRSR